MKLANQTKMIVSRFTGPLCHLMLVFILGIVDQDALKSYALMQGLFMLSTVSLNQYAEQFMLNRIIVNQSANLTQPLIFGVGIIAIIFFVIEFNELSYELIVGVPIFIFTHLAIKINATERRSFGENVSAIFWEFSARSLLLVAYVFINLLAFERSSLMMVSEGYIFSSLLVTAIFARQFRGVHLSVKNVFDSGFIYLVIGIVMVSVSQMEILASSRFVSGEDFVQFKTIQQICSIFTILVNITFLSKIKNLYELDSESKDFYKNYVQIIISALRWSLIFISLLIVFLFVDLGGQAKIWSFSILMLIFLLISALFGPQSMYFYKKNKPYVVLISLVLAFIVKAVMFTIAVRHNYIELDLLIYIFGMGLFVQNTFLWTMLKFNKLLKRETTS